MLKDDLYVDLFYDLHKDEVRWNSNVKTERVGDIITEFLLMQVGAGEDIRKPNKLERYNIRLEVDLSEDAFRVTKDNTGNKGLRDGILIRCANALLNRGVQTGTQAHGMG